MAGPWPSIEVCRPTAKGACGPWSLPLNMPADPSVLGVMENVVSQT